MKYSVGDKIDLGNGVTAEVLKILSNAYLLSFSSGTEKCVAFQNADTGRFSLELKYTGVKAILTTSLSVLSKLRTLDLIRSDKRLYPDRHFNYIDVVVNDITVHGLVYYKVIKLVGDDMFVVAGYGEFLGVVKENCKQVQRNNDWYIDASHSRMEDVYYAIKDAGISMDLEQFRGYF